LAPVNVMLAMVNAVGRLLVNVTAAGLLVLPGNPTTLSEVGETAACTTPVPIKLTGVSTTL